MRILFILLLCSFNSLGQNISVNIDGRYPTFVQADSMIGALSGGDTVSLSNRINQKQNFSDTNTYDATKTNLNTGLALKVNTSALAGTSNVVQKSTGTGTIGNSQISDDATTVTISKTVAAGLGADLLLLNPSATATSVRLRFSPSSSGGIRYSMIEGQNIGSNNIDLRFYTGNGATITEKMRINPNGRIAIGGFDPQAWLHLQGGSTTNAPFLFSSGSFLTTPVAGGFEYNGAFAFTPSSGVRKAPALFSFATPGNGAIIQGNGTDFTLLSLGTANQQLRANSGATSLEYFTAQITNTATLDFTSTLAGTSSELTITVTGAADGDVVSLGVPNVSTNANSCFTARVSATNTVSVKFNNYSALPIDPASGTFKVTVFKY